MSKFRLFLSTWPLLRNLAFADGDLWRLLRQRMTATFSSGKFTAMFPLIVERTELLQVRALLLGTDGNQLDARELLAQYITDTIGVCRFGLDTDSLQDEESTVNFEMTSSATSTTFNELAHKPVVQAKVQEDIERVLEQQGNKLSYEAINALHTLFAKNSSDEEPVPYRDYVFTTLSAMGKELFYAVGVHPLCEAKGGYCLPRASCIEKKMLYISRVCYTRDLVCCYDDTVRFPNVGQ